MRSRAAHPWLALLVVLGVVPGIAEAARFRVHATSAAEAYQQVTSGHDLLARRRFTQWLGLGAHDLTGDDTDRLSVVAELRLDSDFGLSEDDVDRTRGLRNHTLAVMLGYVDARALVPWTDLRIGRQLLTDAASGLALVDGLRATVRTPVYFGVEALVGVEAQNGLLTVTGLELDGVETPAGPTLVTGAAAFLTGLSEVDLRLDYQRWATDGSVQREVVAASGYARPVPWLAFGGDLRYDLFTSFIDRATGELRVRPVTALEILGEYEHYRPSFRADSIFAVFATDPYDEVGGRVRVALGESFSAWLGGSARFYGTEELRGGSVDAVVRGGLALDLGGTSLTADLVRDGESGGQFLLADVRGRHVFGDDRAGIDLRVTFLQYHDAIRDGRDTNAFGFGVGGFYRVRDVATFHLMLEDNESALVTHAWRALLVADLELWM